MSETVNMMIDPISGRAQRSCWAFECDLARFDKLYDQSKPSRFAVQLRSIIRLYSTSSHVLPSRVRPTTKKSCYDKVVRHSVCDLKRSSFSGVQSNDIKPNQRVNANVLLSSKIREALESSSQSVCVQSRLMHRPPALSDVSDLDEPRLSCCKYPGSNNAEVFRTRSGWFLNDTVLVRN